MKRFEDKPYNTYNVSNALSLGVNVKCPKCHRFGVVTEDKTTAFFSVQLVCMHREKNVLFILMMLKISVNVVEGFIV